MMDLPAPTISFCIPTYNRAAFLAQSLDAILSQLTPANASRVEILVSDNASVDNSGEVVRERMTPGRRLRLITNPRNLGMDNNFLGCFENASGKFVCLVSDDDFLTFGSIDYLLAIIDLHADIGAIFLNSFSIGGGALFEEGIVSDRDVSLERISNRIFHIGALVFDRALFSKSKYLDFVGSMIVQSHVYLDVIASERSIYFSKKRFFNITENNSSGGYSFFRVFVENFGVLMARARAIGFSTDVIDRIQSRHLRYFLIPFIVDFRLNASHARVDKNFFEGFRLIVKQYGISLPVLAGVAPAIFLPKWTWIFIRSVVRGWRAALGSKSRKAIRSSLKSQ